MAQERRVDVLILGGGPAGSAAAALLAAGGIETVMLDRANLPRLHVGESLLPHTLPPLDQLGVHDTVRALAHTRRSDGASFVTHDGSRHVNYWFEDALQPAVPYAYHVRRDELDAALLANARDHGAELLEGWRATVPHWDGTRLAALTVRHESGDELRLRPRVLLDASGQGSFLASRMGWRFPYPKHRKVAALAHFRGAWLPPGREAGNTTIVVTTDGWFWLIPFADDTVSVGAVLDAERWRHAASGPEVLFGAAMAATPEIGRRLAGAERLIPFEAAQNFSYRVMRTAGDGYCLIGDAAGFLDPVFSTGVLVAISTAASAAEDIIDALHRHNRVEANDFAPTVALTRQLQRVFFSLIRGFHNPHFIALLFNPRPSLSLPGAVVSLLAGDVLRPGRWRLTGRYRLLRALSLLQGAGERWGRPLVEPLATTPGRRAP